MTQFTDYQPREHWTLRIPGWRFASYLIALYVALCVLMALGCNRVSTPGVLTQTQITELRERARQTPQANPEFKVSGGDGGGDR